MLDRNAFLRPPRLAREPFEIPNLGLVYIRELTGAERDGFEAVLAKAEASGTFAGLRAALLIAAVCDEQGARIFLDNDQALVDALPGRVLVDMFAVAARLSALRKEDVEALGKDSASDLRGTSPSSSPNASEA